MLTYEVIEPHVVDPAEPGQSRDEAILSAAQEAYGYHVLIVHADADARTPDSARKDRFAPGQTLVEKHAAAGGSVCSTLAPLIPVRMIESWMIADPETLLDVIGTSLPAEKTELPANPRRVETITDPKRAIEEAIRIAVPSKRRRKGIKTGSLHGPVALRMDLNRLRRVSSYQKFQADLKAALLSLDILRR